MAKKGLVRKITKTTDDPEKKEFQTEGIEGTKEIEQKKEEEKKEEEKKVIRGEDVLKILRAKGYKI